MVSSRQFTKRQSALGLMLAVLLLFVIWAVILTLHALAAPAQGNISQPSSASTPKQSLVATTITTRGKTVAFTYPSFFGATTSQPFSAPVLERYSFLRHQAGSWQLQVEVDTLLSSDVRTDSGYALRAKNPASYTQEILTLQGQRVYIMTDTTAATFNKVAFMVHQGKLATIALSGGLPDDLRNMQAVFMAILQHWQWL